MKVKIKFITFFTFGLLLFFLYISLMVIFSLEVVLPWIGMQDNTVVFVTVFIASFISGGIFLSTYFVQPIVSMMTLISEISSNNYSHQKLWDKIKRKNGKLKVRYWLYKELLSDLDLLTEKLKQSEIERVKLEEAKKDWVRGISHDLKTPLSYIVGYSSLLLSPDHEWEKEEQQNFLSQIFEKGKYIESLINNMNLSFRLNDSTKPMPLQITSIDLIAFMERLVADFINQNVNEQYDLSLQVLDVCLNIEADEQFLYRAFSNLISNSIRHNPAKTKIVVEVKRGREGNVIVSIKDNGVGMSQEKINMLFENYHDNAIASNNKRDYVGGLGLSIVKNIIDAHHGEMIVESKVDEGTIFTVSLPTQ
jgi:signal transduction histidine kinase